MQTGWWWEDSRSGGDGGDGGGRWCGGGDVVVMVVVVLSASSVSTHRPRQHIVRVNTSSAPSVVHPSSSSIHPHRRSILVVTLSHSQVVWRPVVVRVASSRPAAVAKTAAAPAQSQAPKKHPRGRLTIVRAAVATVVAHWVVVVVRE
ncbi:hypothetical protein BDZ89DRAFT_1047614 [Hymenopellis radicata]|nr:hypothetical protein BDZ89DRAFT_1047614 [Hymenopellis radicata]